MKLHTICFAGLLLFAGCGPTNTTTPVAHSPAKAAPDVIFNVTNMVCDGCEMGVRDAVGAIEGVDSVEASFKSGTAKVYLKPGVKADEALIAKMIAAIEDNPSHKATVATNPSR